MQLLRVSLFSKLWKGFPEKVQFFWNNKIQDDRRLLLVIWFSLRSLKASIDRDSLDIALSTNLLSGTIRPGINHALRDEVKLNKTLFFYSLEIVFSWRLHWFRWLAILFAHQTLLAINDDDVFLALWAHSSVSSSMQRTLFDYTVDKLCISYTVKKFHMKPEN